MPNGLGLSDLMQFLEQARAPGTRLTDIIGLSGIADRPPPQGGLIRRAGLAQAPIGGLGQQGPPSAPIGGLGQQPVGGRPAPGGSRVTSPQPLAGRPAPTRRTGGSAMRPSRFMGRRRVVGGDPRLDPFGGRRFGGARAFLRSGRVNPFARFQPGRAGFPGSRQVSSFILGGRR